MEITVATPADLAEILPYLDTAYNFAPGFFATRLASQWNEEGVDWSGVFMVRGADNCIRSLVRIWEMTLIQDGRSVVCGGIGSVSTLKTARGAGHMSALMNHCNAEMKRRGYPIAILWGDRFRYATFGYESGGRGASFSVEARGLRRCGIEALQPRELDDEILAQIEAARLKTAFHRVRTLGEVARMYRTPTRRVLAAGEAENFGWLVWDGNRVVEWGGAMSTVLGLAAHGTEQKISEKWGFGLPDAKFAPPELLAVMSGWSMSSESCRAAILDLPKTLQTFEMETPPSELEKLDSRAQVWQLFGRPGAPRNLWMSALDTI